MALRLPTLQPHSGAVIMALYHYLKFPGSPHFDVRMTEPFPRIYRIEREAIMDGILIFRTGKDWPCYTRIYVKNNATEFSMRHSHSGVEEEFQISGNDLYNGRLKTEGGVDVKFEGVFYHNKKLQLTEEYRRDGKLLAPRRYYEVDRSW